MSCYWTEASLLSVVLEHCSSDKIRNRFTEFFIVVSAREMGPIEYHHICRIVMYHINNLGAIHCPAF